MSGSKCVGKQAGKQAQTKLQAQIKVVVVVASKFAKALHTLFWRGCTVTM